MALGRWGGGPGRGGGWEGGGGGHGSAQPQCEVAAGGLGPASEIVLTLASFAVTKLAYVRVTRAFREAYARQSGRDVRFRLTFAASGVQVGGAGARGPSARWGVGPWGVVWCEAWARAVMCSCGTCALGRGPEAEAAAGAAPGAECWCLRRAPGHRVAAGQQAQRGGGGSCVPAPPAAFDPRCLTTSCGVDEVQAPPRAGRGARRKPSTPGPRARKKQCCASSSTTPTPVHLPCVHPLPPACRPAP